MVDCSMTRSEESKNWPDGIISARMTMNPYLLAMAAEEAYKNGLKPWEYINLAIWERLGRPEHDTLMEFAANLEVEELDPQWKKRLKITARLEVEKAAALDHMRETAGVADSGHEEEISDTQ